MLSLDDVALARLAIAAGRVPPEQRSEWLQELARGVEQRRGAGAERRRARQRRYRERQRSGELVVSVGLSEAETDKLFRLRCVDADKLENRAALVAAVHLLLAHIEA